MLRIAVAGLLGVCACCVWSAWVVLRTTLVVENRGAEDLCHTRLVFIDPVYYAIHEDIDLGTLRAGEDVDVHVMPSASDTLRLEIGECGARQYRIAELSPYWVPSRYPVVIDGESITIDGHRPARVETRPLTAEDRSRD